MTLNFLIWSTLYLTSKVSYDMLWRFLLYTAALSVGVFGAQTQFRFVVFQVEQLLWVERSTTLSDNMRETKRDSLTNYMLEQSRELGEEQSLYSQSYEMHCIFILHPTLN